MNYLPFRCKYCGGSFCRDHRLPENHDCTGQFTAPIIIPPKIQEKMGIEFQPGDQRERRRPLYRDTDEYAFDAKSGRVKKARLNVLPPFLRSAFQRSQVTYIIMILNIVGFILSLIDVTVPFVIIIPYYLFRHYFFFTLLTSIFVPTVGTSFLGVLVFLIVEYMFFIFGRQMESKYGGKFLALFVLVSGFFTGAFFILAAGIGTLIPSIALILLSSLGGMGTNYGVIIAFIVFLAAQTPNQSGYVMFIPIPIRMKWIAVIFIAIVTIPLLLYWFVSFDPIYLCEIIAYFGAVLGGYVMAKFTPRAPVNRPPVQFIEM